MRSIAFIVSLLLSFNAFAGEVCMDVPEGVTYASASPNLDGSIYIELPKVFAGGDYLELDASRGAANGVCVLLGKSKLLDYDSHRPEAERLANLNEKGEFQGLLTNMPWSLSWVICK